MNKPTEPLTRPSLPDSKLMSDAMSAARFMVNLKELPPGAVSNETILAHYQAMVDNRVIDLMAATVTLCIEMIKNGYIKRPDTYPETSAPKPLSSRLIVPPGVPNRKRK